MRKHHVKFQSDITSIPEKNLGYNGENLFNGFLLQQKRFGLCCLRIL